MKKDRKDELKRDEKALLMFLRGFKRNMSILSKEFKEKQKGLEIQIIFKERLTIVFPGHPMVKTRVTKDSRLSRHVTSHWRGRNKNIGGICLLVFDSQQNFKIDFSTPSAKLSL